MICPIDSSIHPLNNWGLVCRQLISYSAAFKWLSKNQYPSNYSDKLQHEKAVRWTNQNPYQSAGKSREQGGSDFGFGFASYWLKIWRDIFKPITKRSNRSRVITFDSHLKTAQCTVCQDYLSHDDMRGLPKLQSLTTILLRTALTGKVEFHRGCDVLWNSPFTLYLKCPVTVELRTFVLERK